MTEKKSEKEGRMKRGRKGKRRRKLLQWGESEVVRKRNKKGQLEKHKQRSVHMSVFVWVNFTSVSSFMRLKRSV